MSRMIFSFIRIVILVAAPMSAHAGEKIYNNPDIDFDKLVGDKPFPLAHEFCRKQGFLGASEIDVGKVKRQGKSALNKFSIEIKKVVCTTDPASVSNVGRSKGKKTKVDAGANATVYAEAPAGALR